MLETWNHGRLAKMKRELEALAGSSPEVIPRLSDALRDVLTAVNYADDALMASSVNSLFSCLADVVRSIIQQELNKSKQVKDTIKRTWQHDIDGAVCEDFDELKNVIESIIDGRIAMLTKVRDELVKCLEEKEYHVDNGQQLEDGIRDLRKFRENLLKDWPPSSKTPSPLNKDAIAEARKSLAKGVNGMKKDELIWGNDPKKAN